MVVASAGRFMMGSPWWEVFRFPWEGPVHEMTIARPFAVGVYEVTFEEWDACARTGGRRRTTSGGGDEIGLNRANLGTCVYLAGCARGEDARDGCAPGEIADAGESLAHATRGPGAVRKLLI